DGRGRGRDGDGKGRGGEGRGRGGDSKGRDGKGRDGDGRGRDGGGRGRDGDGRGRDGGGDKPRRERGDRRPRRDEHDDRPKPKRLRPGRVHRQTWIDTLPTEQKVVAEQLSRGGIQAVRKEIDTQNEKAKADGTNAIDGSALIALAESLMPKLRDAEWRDRAEAALADVDEIDLRDLRSVVAAESAHDKESRELANQLRDALNARVERAQAEWVDEVASTLSEGRVVRALRVSSRSPKAGARLPDDLLQNLILATNGSVTAETGQQRLATVLDAVSRSVVRPHFKLEHVPDKPSDDLLETVRKVSSQLPEVAAQFGVTPSRRPRRGKKPPVPPKPTSQAKPKPETEPTPEPGPTVEAPAPEEAAPAPSEALPAAETHEALPAAEIHEALPAAETHEALPAAETHEALPPAE
ncbi:MAG: hypothetical protein GY708_00590, partial [Actinomycetia bacterium]|nr:hypothetical protein [Actinomycetes bacterium]